MPSLSPEKLFARSPGAEGTKSLLPKGSPSLGNGVFFVFQEDRVEYNRLNRGSACREYSRFLGPCFFSEFRPGRRPRSRPSPAPSPIQPGPSSRTSQSARRTSPPISPHQPHRMRQASAVGGAQIGSAAAKRQLVHPIHADAVRRNVFPDRSFALAVIRVLRRSSAIQVADVAGPNPRTLQVEPLGHLPFGFEGESMILVAGTVGEVVDGGVLGEHARLVDIG